MSLGDLEKGFRALATALDAKADKARPMPGDADPTAQLAATIVLFQLSEALKGAANDLEDQQRERYGLAPKHGEPTE
jgi:hypothetical protein